MPDLGVFPNFPGLSWSVTKSPIFQTRIQRSVSGRELRALDYPYPLWQFTLTFDFLRDRNDFDELRTLAGFYMQCHGAFGTFLYSDPNDSLTIGQLLPPATSVVTNASLNTGGSGYSVNQVLQLLGGVTGNPAAFNVTSIGGGGAVTSVSLNNPGAYTQIPGITAVPLVGGGASVNLTWSTTTQLVRTFGGFIENITAPHAILNIYYNGIPQSGWSVDGSTGVVVLPNSFAGPTYTVAAPPVLVARGSGYIVGNTVGLAGTSYGSAYPIFVSSLYGSGGILLPTNPDGSLPLQSPLGAYSSIVANPVPVFGGNGAGAEFNVTWATQVQPVISADFSYYFRCRFVDDRYDFENFMLRLWQLKKLQFISVMP
jgi:hypothetical protein